jgi:hypothetical protein
VEAEEPGFRVRDSGFAEEDGAVASAASQGGVVPPCCESRAPNPESRSSSANPESRTPNPVSSPKPKRKYTTSEKSRNASRQNLQKANQAPKELKYRNTPRRQAARLKGLERAAAVLRQFDSLYYGLGFKRGTYCASLRRSLALAGEKKEEYEEHLDLMRQAFAPLSDHDRKLVQAAAEAVWRRLRVYGGHGRWEMYAVATVLVELIAERERAAAASPGGAGGPVEVITPHRAYLLGLELIRLLMEAKVGREARRLNLRIERLLRGLVLATNGQPLVVDAKPRPEEANYHQRSAEGLGNPLSSVAEVAATLKQDRGKDKGTEECQTGEGAAAGGAAGGEAGGGIGTGAEEATEERAERGANGGPNGGIDSERRSRGCASAADVARHGGLMRLLHQRGVTDADMSKLEGPQGKAAWTDLWLRALGIDDCPGIDDCRLSIDDSTTAAGAAPTQAGSAFQSSVDDRRSSVLAMAEITWERVQTLLRHREKEAAQVREVLQARIPAQQAAAEDRLPIADCPEDETRNSKFETHPPNEDSSRESSVSSSEPPAAGSEPSSIDPARRDQSAISLLGALAVFSCGALMTEAGMEIKAAYYRVLVALYGDLPGFDYFQPKKPTPGERLEIMSDMVSELFTLRAGAAARGEILWRGGSRGRQAGGGP